MNNTVLELIGKQNWKNNIEKDCLIWDIGCFRYKIYKSPEDFYNIYTVYFYVGAPVYVLVYETRFTSCLDAIESVQAHFEEMILGVFK